MSLNYDLSKINPIAICYNNGNRDDGLTGATQSLIFYTMSAGFCQITEGNAADFYARLCVLRKLFGPMYRTPDGPLEVTPQDVIAHIGLRTNASTQTDATWRKYIMDSQIRENLYQFHRAFRGSEEKS